MHEWKNYYIFCFTSVLPHFEDKDLITNALWDRISQTGLCPVIFAHCAMVETKNIGIFGSNFYPLPHSGGRDKATCKKKKFTLTICHYSSIFLSEGEASPSFQSCILQPGTLIWNVLNNDILKDQNSKVKLVLSYLGLCVESWNSSFKGKKCIIFYYIFLKLGEGGSSQM